MTTCLSIIVLLVSGLVALFCAPAAFKAIGDGQSKPVLFGIAAGIALAVIVYWLVSFWDIALSSLGPFAITP